MKKYFVVYVGFITLGLLIFSYQTNTNLNDVQEVIDVKEVTTTTTLKIDNSWNNFLNAWEKSLNIPIELTYQENIINSSFLNKWEWKGDKSTAQEEFLYQIEVNGYTCTRIWNSMGWALLDMVHPIGKDFRAPHTYKCDDKGEVFIFGEPFYFNNEWWVFQNYEWSWEDFNCIDPCGSSAQYYATIFVVENSEELKNFTLSNPVIYNKLFKNYHSYRGIIRRTTAESISIVGIEKDLYTEKVIKPVHDFSESFSYDIKIPEINSSMKCAPEVNNEIMIIVNELVEDKKSILEITTPEKAEEEWGGFIETLEIKYDILEISEYLISVFISNTTYSFGAAHPQSFTQSINIYVPDCTNFDFHKLFDKSLNNNTFTYEDVVAKEMQNQLCAQFESRSDCDNYLSFVKPFPKLSDLEECCSAIGLNELGIFVQFWAYEVSSYAEGSELILVPWHNLEILLDRSSKYKDMLEYYSTRIDLETQYEPSWSYVETNK